jgi:glycosyltransferase involved in cell wall biosynthesis
MTGKDIQVSKLTICSAYHAAESKRLLELNRETAERLNPGVSFYWLAADNTPAGFRDTADKSKFAVSRGAASDHSVPRWVRGSVQYAAGLNTLVPYITTRFALILDSDFYIVRPGWIAEVLTHMLERDLAFFGVPWHPAWHRKPRAFPAPHTLFIDLEKIPREKLDFLPQYDFSSPGLLRKIERRAYKMLPSAVIRRLETGTSLDVASKLYLLYRNNPSIRYESVVPVYTPPAPGKADFFLPERFVRLHPSFSFSSAGFAESGLYDARKEGWEEFLWKGAPYGFHVRGSHKLKENFEKGLARVRGAIESCVRSGAGKNA